MRKLCVCMDVDVSCLICWLYLLYVQAQRVGLCSLYSITVALLYENVSVLSGEASLNSPLLPSCQCMKMKSVLLLKGMRGTHVIDHDCSQTLTHPLIMYDNGFSLSPPCFHGCASQWQPCKYQIVCHHSLRTLHGVLDCACMKLASCVFVCKRKRGMAGYCTAVLIKTCSPHNVSAPAPNTTTHSLSLSHKHTHIDNLKSSDPPSQTWLTCRY